MTHSNKRTTQIHLERGAQRVRLRPSRFRDCGAVYSAVRMLVK
jgi:hypothetical protein